MLIGIDVGNTNITVGIFEDNTDRIEPLYSWRFNTLLYETPDEIAAPIISHFLLNKIDSAKIKNAIISCVVPTLIYSLKKMLKNTFGISEPVMIDHNTDSGMGFDYPNPSEVGADRIVNAAAAIELYGTPLVIIDFGTATTFCCISEDRKYLGGQIIPGIGISLDALTNKAAKLFGVRVNVPESPLGKSTEKGMISGIYYQTVGAVEKIVGLLIDEIGGAKPKVLATGGFATLFKNSTDCIEIVDPDLTLKGLKIIYSKISK